MIKLTELLKDPSMSRVKFRTARPTISGNSATFTPRDLLNLPASRLFLRYCIAKSWFWNEEPSW